MGIGGKPKETKMALTDHGKIMAVIRAIKASRSGECSWNDALYKYCGSVPADDIDRIAKAYISEHPITPGAAAPAVKGAQNE
jgi:hypothetical protein